ncbi:hypothetical protein I8D64_00470 [Brachybacterium sp. MASK1Z-5]|uniref:DUF4388 domain-containing protein n=1 Tax=Brachybacterium halotolerans TaxID=2795215 RepID=A0ABS1B5H9_9MICO|nr:hypothetical protein [Brachybacterium halotolerans]MBK0329880.1 hypothetical protein [Brachybacterium halotolerans]
MSTSTAWEPAGAPGTGPVFDERDYYCATGLLAMVEDRIGDLLVLTDEEVMALDGADRPTLSATPLLDLAGEGLDRSQAALAVLRGLVARGLLGPDTFDPTFLEVFGKDLPPERVAALAADAGMADDYVLAPALAGIHCLRHRPDSLLDVLVTRGARRTEWMYYLHAGGGVLEEKILQDGFHVFSLLPLTDLPERVAGLMDPQGVIARAGGEADADGETPGTDQREESVPGRTADRTLTLRRDGEDPAELGELPTISVLSAFGVFPDDIGAEAPSARGDASGDSAAPGLEDVDPGTAEPRGRRLVVAAGADGVYGAAIEDERPDLFDADGTLVLDETTREEFLGSILMATPLARLDGEILRTEPDTSGLSRDGDRSGARAATRVMLQVLSEATEATQAAEATDVAARPRSDAD